MMDINKPKPGIQYYVLATLAFVIAPFAVQATSHFVLNADHYAAVGFMRDEPIMALGIFTMIVQGAILAYLFTFFLPRRRAAPAGVEIWTVDGGVFRELADIGGACEIHCSVDPRLDDGRGIGQPGAVRSLRCSRRADL